MAQLNSNSGTFTNTKQPSNISATLHAFAPSGIKTGHPFWLGIQLNHPAGWHSYWLNPGDAGLPTTIAWQLPPGLSSKPIEWPKPQRISTGPLVSYGYTDQVVLIIPVEVTPTFNSTSFVIQADVHWLACREICIPESAQLKTTVTSHYPLVDDEPLFQQTFTQIPHQIISKEHTANIRTEGLELVLHDLPPDWKNKSLMIYPESDLALDHTYSPQWVWNNTTARTLIRLQRLPEIDIKNLSFVLAPDNAILHPQLPESTPAAIRSSMDVLGDWRTLEIAPPTSSAHTPINSSMNPTKDYANNLGSWLTIIALAFLGGAILNLMPCVFPVLSLKLFHLSTHAQTPSQRIYKSLAYTAGVVLSMLALGLAMLALRAGGEHLGWGFQLQSPPFVALLCLLFGVMALHMHGWFEVGQLLPQRWGHFYSKHTYTNEFLTGLLSVIAASPCTAPWMATSLGATLILPPAQAACVFIALGLGLAAPHWIISASPSWVRFLPRSGPWLIRIKGILAYPLWATSIALLWVLGQQVGSGSVAVTLVTFLILSIILKEQQYPAQTVLKRWVWRLFYAGSFISCLLWAWPYWKIAKPSQYVTSTEALTQKDAVWLRWTPSKQNELLEKGVPFFIDFTAAWCITCQYNKIQTLSNPDVLNAFSTQKVQLLRADWTLYDPAITQALNELERTGVPTYALYTGNPEKKMVVLREVLTPGYVMDALNQVQAIKKP